MSNTSNIPQNKNTKELLEWAQAQVEKQNRPTFNQIKASNALYYERTGVTPMQPAVLLINPVKRPQ